MRFLFRRLCAAGFVTVLAVVLIALGTGDAQGIIANQYLIATGPGPGGGPHVALFKASDAKTQINFFAYAPSFSGGVDVALGDLNGDGKLEVVTGPGPGGGPHVRVFSDHGVPIDAWGFFAYSAGFSGGVSVGVADIDGDDEKEILTAPATGGPPLVRVWDIVGNKAVQVGEFLAYGSTFNGGVDIDGAYTDATNREGIVTAAGPGGGPHVRTFSATFAPVGSWFAYDPSYPGGVTVSAYTEDLNPGSEIVTGSRTARGHVRSFSATGIAKSVNFYAWDASVDAGVAVGSIDDDSHGPFVVGPFRAGGPRPCSALENPPNCKRGDYFRGVDDDGDWTIQNLPYGATWKGGMRVAGGFGTFDDYGTVFNPTTTSTSAPATTTSTSTTSTTVAPTTTSTTT
ncbi:MAG: hypothetical protein Q8K63_11445 [Acidimicrobiales bacterium]|nr:hypothetical protein [Acidimicrobiales bacterium]